MDFLEAGYISSIGLREFLILCERLSEGTPVIAENCNELVAGILEMTGFNAYVQVRRRHDKLDRISWVLFDDETFQAYSEALKQTVNN